MSDQSRNADKGPCKMDGDLQQTLKNQQEAIAQLMATCSERQQQLGRTQKMAVLGTLVHGIAHEIKTPLGAIHSAQGTMAKALEKLRTSLEQASPSICEQNKGVRLALTALDEVGAVIASGSKRTLEIVQRVRKFVHPGDNECIKADINTELEDTLLLLNHELKNRIELKREFGDLPAACCNVGQINQVFLNVLVNAAQAIEGPGTITIRTRSEEGRINVAVIDTGKGISAGDMKRIFQVGFTTKADSHHGSGLGLAICRQLMGENHGSISLESELGRGTTVTILVPIDGRECETKEADLG